MKFSSFVSTIAILLVSGTTSWSVNVGVPATKLVLTQTPDQNKAKTTFSAKDPAIASGLGSDPAQISATFTVKYLSGGLMGGGFTMPLGDPGWLRNDGLKAQFKNREAPAGVTQVSSAKVKAGRLQLTAKGLGDVPPAFMSSPFGDYATGQVFTSYCVTNAGIETCYCSVFPTTLCKYTPGNAGKQKLICKYGTPDVTCEAKAALTSELTCASANGLLWCRHPTECGRACDDTCAAFALTPADDATWLAAQDTYGECSAISAAFGLGSLVIIDSFDYACAEDFGDHTSAGVRAPLVCSDRATCPTAHRTTMEQLGIPCGPSSARSICPCQAGSPSQAFID